MKVSAATSSKKSNEDHNLNELENKNEADGRLANGHAGRSLSAGKRNSPVRVNGDCEEDSDSGESSNTSSNSSCPGGSKKESQNKTTQVLLCELRMGLLSICVPKNVTLT